MKCTDKERQTCNVEKMGCEGCYYNEDKNRDIEILEEFIKYYESEAISRKFRGTLSISVDEYDIEAIEHLIKAYKELKEENKIWKDNYYKQKEFNNKQALYIIDNFIPVSLVEEKIEELNKQLEEDLQDEIKVNSNRFIIIWQCKKCLQELLEKRK